MSPFLQMVIKSTQWQPEMMLLVKPVMVPLVSVGFIVPPCAIFGRWATHLQLSVAEATQIKLKLVSREHQSAVEIKYMRFTEVLDSPT